MKVGLLQHENILMSILTSANFFIYLWK